MTPIYLVIWEYYRGQNVISQYGAKQLIAVWKTTFEEAQAILEREVFPHLQQKQLMYEYWIREPDTNFLREQAKEWKG